MSKWIIGGLFLGIACIAIFDEGSPGKRPKVVAIVTLASHPSLDAVVENAKRELKREGFSEGRDVQFIEKNANGQVQLAAGIANELAARNPDAIIAITTPMTQAVAKVAKCPVIFAAVTDPVGAGLMNSLEQAAANITGVSDAWNYEDQLKLVLKITPRVKRLGVLYNPGEASSQYSMRELRRYAPALHLELVEGAVNSVSEVYPVAENLSGRVDALMISSDNTVISGAPAALKVAVAHKIPLYVGDSGTVERGGLAALSAGYSAIGVEAGKLTARVLRGESRIPAVVLRGSELYINSRAATLMGVSIPEEILAQATQVFGDIK